MKRGTRYSLAFLAAALVPSLVISLPNAVANLNTGDSQAIVRTWKAIMAALAVSAAHVLALGLPAFLVVVRAKMFAWWSAVGLGFILGALPLALLSWPLRYSEGASARHWENGQMIETIVNGVVTRAGWWSYVSGVVSMGCLGAVGGLSFWLVLRALKPDPSIEATA